MDKGLYRLETTGKLQREGLWDGIAVSYVRVSGHVRPINPRHSMDLLFYRLADEQCVIQHMSFLILPPVSTCPKTRFDFP